MRLFAAAFYCGAMTCVASSVNAKANNPFDPSVFAGKCDSAVGNKIAALAKSSLPASGWSGVILRLADGSLESNRAESLAALGADVYRRLPMISSVAVRVPNRNLTKLAALPFVSHLSLDGSVTKNDEFVVGRSGADVANASYGLDGTGVGVAVLDSGIYNHPDLQNAKGSASRIVAAANFSGESSAADNCGHGTHVAGIIAGNGASSSASNNTQTFYGIARNANLINVRVLNSVGQGTVSGVVAGIAWVVQHKSAYNIRVLNVSLGHSVGDYYANDPLCQAVEAAYKAGIVVVCAAGNNGRLYPMNFLGGSNEGWGTNYGSIQSPGNDPYVITVGAMKYVSPHRADDVIATYSSRGPSLADGVLKPDIVAPGNQVISTLATGSFLQAMYGVTNSVPVYHYTSGKAKGSSVSYFYLSGTSMASPVVAGAAALLIQHTPGLSPDSVKAQLMLSADKWTNADGSYDACTYGAGYLDIPAALSLANVTAGRSAMSPTITRDNAHDVIVDVKQSIWGPAKSGGAGIWGISGLTSMQALWGAGAVANAQVVWNSQNLISSVLTNSSTVGGDQVLWGGSGTDENVSSPSSPPSDSAWVDLSIAAILGEM